MKKIHKIHNFTKIFSFHNKQKEFLNELNSLVAIYFIISLCYENKWTSKIFFPLKPDKLSIAKFF